MSDIFRHIRKVQQPHHDTLYCNPTQRKTLVSEIGDVRGGAANLNSLRISGLDVVTHPRFVVPIACEKGEVFDLTEDYD